MKDEKDPFRCPICRHPSKLGSKPFPFCSDRCRLMDLGSWFNEDYRVSRSLFPSEWTDEEVSPEGWAEED